MQASQYLIKLVVCMAQQAVEVMQTAPAHINTLMCPCTDPPLLLLLCRHRAVAPAEHGTVYKVDLSGGIPQLCDPSNGWRQNAEARDAVPPEGDCAAPAFLAVQGQAECPAQGGQVSPALVVCGTAGLHGI